MPWPIHAGCGVAATVAAGDVGAHGGAIVVAAADVAPNGCCVAAAAVAVGDDDGDAGDGDGGGRDGRSSPAHPGIARANDRRGWACRPVAPT